MMGADITTKRAGAFKKKWDRGKAELAMPNLFAQEGKVRELYVAVSEGDHNFAIGESLLVIADNGVAKLYRGNRRIGHLAKLTNSIMQSLKKHNACATVVKVRSDNRRSDVVLT